jgi:hypothetical protein
MKDYALDANAVLHYFELERLKVVRSLAFYSAGKGRPGESEMSSAAARIRAASRVPVRYHHRHLKFA